MESNKALEWNDIKHDPNAVKVLDHGFVYLKSTYGTDSTVCEAARISYGSGTKKSLDDRNLIRYLIRHSHTSPLEQCCATFILKLPLFVMGQLVRHRTAKLNQYSGRYSIMPDDFFIPEELNNQSSNNKQGRSDKSLFSDKFIESYNTITNDCKDLYNDMIDAGISREQSRIILPQNQYTLCVWQMDLHNLMHFLKLRLDKHAQKEIRDYANAIYGLLKNKFPVCFEAFEDYKLYSKSFSGPEMKILKEKLKNISFSDEEFTKLGLSKREITEFREKFLD